MVEKMRSFLILGNNNNIVDFVNQHYLRNYFRTCYFCHGKKWLKLTKGLYSQFKEDEHDTQIVSDTMYKTR